MELSACQLEQLKKVELELLQAFVALCDRLGLKYFVLGGTLLGAVRHQGFIPWDDDIDVGMLRADYETLMAQGQKYLPEGIFLQNHVTDPEYPLNFAKLRRDNTIFMEHSLSRCHIHHGAYIDIFPLDSCPERNVQLFRLKNRLMRWRISFAFPADALSVHTRLLRWLSLPLYPSRKETVKKREKLLRSGTSPSRIANHCGAWGEKETVPALWYGEGTYLAFEGIPVRAPAEYEAWLTQVYGDYMQLPPEEKRVPHHFADAFDMEGAL